MLRILTLGGLTVQSPGRFLAGPQARLQGLALLARLAVAGERGVSRDKLVGYFWPEREESRALHSLSQALHLLRVDLGDDALFVGTRILRLDPERVTSDVGDMERAQHAHDRARIVELYGGPFLDGIYLAGAAEFERWVSIVRQQLLGAYSTALRELATAAAAAGKLGDAARWWQQLAATDPFDTSVAIELVRALAAAGDEVGALREARVHQALVRTELCAEPDTRLAQLIARLEPHRTNGRPAARPLAPEPEPPVVTDPLSTDELCARARQRLYAFTRASLAEGIRYAERAVELSPDHAEARVTLGSLYITLSQAERGGDPRPRGVEQCRRAAALDPSLGEAQLWLAWAAHLDERYEEAESLALAGLALDPDGLFSHTAVGWARLTYGLRRARWDKCVASVGSFTRALRIHPRDQNLLLALASIYRLAGQYDIARSLLEAAIAVEHWKPGEMRIIGALTLLGQVQLHSGRPDALKYFESADASYRDAPQIFAPYIQAMTLVGLGDLDRLAGRYDEAVAHYSRARRVLEPMPGLIGCGHLMVRIETRLAGVFGRLRMRVEEARHAGRAREIATTRLPYCFSWCWGTSEAEMHYDWAVYHATCANEQAMLASLRDAVSFGWREIGLLDIEPAFATCSGASLTQLASEVRAMAALPPPPVAEQALPAHGVRPPVR